MNNKNYRIAITIVCIILAIVVIACAVWLGYTLGYQQAQYDMFAALGEAFSGIE